MKTTGFYIVFFLLVALKTEAQNKYFLYFSDKSNTPYSISSPQDFLSTKAIQRRKNQGINIVENDLPVDPAYVDSLKSLGVLVWYTSKWLNGALIETDSATLDSLLTLSFITNSTFAGIPPKPGDPYFDYIPDNVPFIKDKSPALLQDYGESLNQNMMIGADEMHALGYNGEGMTIGIFDAGFNGCDFLPVFDSLNLNGKIKGTYDFVDHDVEVYDQGTHGTMVLSSIAGYSEGNLIGTAYGADYYLFRTENTSSEKRIEEFNWLFAAEYADSLGIDIINTSLGYTTFDDSTMDYTYSNMDGNTAIITRATDLAVSKGILCVNSAGNSGSGSWKYIGAPADADSVLAVGAVDSLEHKASFSSFGPSADGRIKPNLCAQGQDVIVCMPNGQFVRSNGTSFSSPILCGMVAGFWSAHPDLTNMEVIEILQSTASNAQNPDDSCGYGIPYFPGAHSFATQGFTDVGTKVDITMFPNPFTGEVLKFKSKKGDAILNIRIFDSKGAMVYASDQNTKHKATVNIKKYALEDGLYFVHIKTATKFHYKKLVIQ